MPTMQMLKQEPYTTQAQQQQQQQPQYTLTASLSQPSQGQMLPPPAILHQAGQHSHHGIAIEASNSSSPLSTPTTSTPGTPTATQQAEMIKRELINQKVRAENRERKKRWREQNEDRNKDNDLRCRVNKRANKIFTNKQDAETKVRWIEEEFIKRQQKRKEKERRKNAVNGAIGANPQLASLSSNQLMQATQAAAQLSQSGLNQLGLAAGGYYPLPSTPMPPLSPGTTAKLLNSNLAALKANKAGTLNHHLLQQLSSGILPESFPNLASIGAAPAQQTQQQQQQANTQQNNGQGTGNGSSPNLQQHLHLGDLNKLSTPPSESVAVGVTTDGTFPADLSPTLLQTSAISQASQAATAAQENAGVLASANSQAGSGTSAGVVTAQPQQQAQQQGQQGSQQQQKGGVQTRQKSNHANQGANPGGANNGGPDYPMDAVLTLMQLNAGWRQ